MAAVEQHQQTQHSEDRRGDAVHDFQGDHPGHLVAQKDRWHVGQHHAQRRAGNHGIEVVIPGGQGDCRDLGLVAHFRKEKGNHGGSEDAETLQLACVFHLVRDHHPGSHANERQTDEPAQHFWAERRGDPAPGQASSGVIREGRNEDAQDDGYVPPELGGKQYGQ